MSIKNVRNSLRRQCWLAMSQLLHFSTAWEVRSNMVWQKDMHAYTWQDLEGKISPEVLCAPKTIGDSTGEYPHIHARIIGYLVRNVVGTPWIDHFALMAAILSARRRDVHTIEVI